MSPTAPVNTSHRLGNLDLLRLFAALMVLVYHYTYTGFVSGGLSPYSFPEIDRLTEHGWAGVSLFFMISGFVIAYSAERSSAYDFMVSRTARLYPAFLFCMTLTALVLVFAAPQKFVEFQVSIARWLANLTMVPLLFKQPFVDGAYWSIVTEITFYFWVTVLIALGLYKRHLMAILWIWIALSAFNQLYLMNPVLNKLFTTQYSCYFVLGILSYRAFKEQRWPRLSEIALGVIALAMTVKSDDVVQNWMIAHYAYAADHSILRSLLKTLAFLAILNGAVRIQPVLKGSWCLVLGGLTYPLYLLHTNIGFTMFSHMHGTFNRWVALLMVTVVMLAMAYAVFRTVEPFGRQIILTLGKRLNIGSIMKHSAIALNGSRSKS